MIDVVSYGHEGYAMRSMVGDEHLRQSSVYWTMHGMLRSFQWRGSRKVVKVRDGFRSHLDPVDFAELLRESAQYGAPRPGSYAGIWWSAKNRPQVATLPNWQKRYGLVQVAGAWQKAFLLGNLAGGWTHYDIRSAYLWSLSMGLPRPDTYRWSSDYRADRRGAWLVNVSPDESLPYPYDGGGDVLATSDEIDLYGLQVEKVYGGITWEGGEYDYDTEAIVDSIRRYGAWKAIARSWWGMLATSRPCVAHYPMTGWQRDLKPHRTNPIWAHVIVGRVRQRLWEVVRDNPGDVARVYCDSVVVRDGTRIGIGEKVGDWREEARYAHGVSVQNAVTIKGAA